MRRRGSAFARFLPPFRPFGCSSPGIGADTHAPAASFVAPPRSIADITAILDQEKPDPAKLAKREADANASRRPRRAEALGEFYFRAARPAPLLGRSRDAIADCEKAVSLGGDYVNHVSRVQQFLETPVSPGRRLQERRKGAADDDREFLQPAERPAAQPVPARHGRRAAAVGDMARAQNYVNRANAILNESRELEQRQVGQFRSTWEANVEDARARLNENRGLYREAEAGYRRAERCRSMPWARRRHGRARRRASNSSSRSIISRHSRGASNTSKAVSRKPKLTSAAPC